jgi:Mn2+/Fe2+ NRAMP family transporter
MHAHRSATPRFAEPALWCRDLAARFGPQMKTVFAVGLLAAGQASTLTGTYTGQRVTEGFFALRQRSVWINLGQRVVTRAIALGPTLFFAFAYAESAQMDVLNHLINISQSVLLPYALLPVLYMTANERVMRAGDPAGAVATGADFRVSGSRRCAVQVRSNHLLLLPLRCDYYYQSATVAPSALSRFHALLGREPYACMHGMHVTRTDARAPMQVVCWALIALNMGLVVQGVLEQGVLDARSAGLVAAAALLYALSLAYFTVGPRVVHRNLLAMDVWPAVAPAAAALRKTFGRADGGIPAHGVHACARGAAEPLLATP